MTEREIAKKITQWRTRVGRSGSSGRTHPEARNQRAGAGGGKSEERRHGEQPETHADIDYQIGDGAARQMGVCNGTGGSALQVLRGGRENENSIFTAEAPRRGENPRKHGLG